MSFSVPIDKLMFHRMGTWTPFESGITNAILKIHCDQLLILTNNSSKILENLNFCCKIKGFLKGDLLILVESKIGSELRKIRFRILDNVGECIRVLGLHFPVVNHESNGAGIIFNSKYRNIEEVLKHAVETMNSKDKESLQTSHMPPEFDNFVRLCLLDPTFPQFVNETEKVLNSI